MKDLQTEPKKDGLRWCGCTDAECLVDAHERTRPSNLYLELNISILLKTGAEVCNMKALDSESALEQGHVRAKFRSNFETKDSDRRLYYFSTDEI